MTVALSPDVNKLFLPEHWSQMQILVNIPLTAAPSWYPNSASEVSWETFSVLQVGKLSQALFWLHPLEISAVCPRHTPLPLLSVPSHFCSIPLWDVSPPSLRFGNEVLPGFMLHSRGGFCPSLYGLSGLSAEGTERRKTA